MSIDIKKKSETKIKQYEVIFEGKKYIKNNEGWRSQDYSTPPSFIIPKLNGLLKDTLLKEADNSDFTTEELIKKADIEKLAKNFIIAEKYIRKAIFQNPKRVILYSKLCSCLRELGKPEQALIDTDNIKIPKDAALLISRAGAMCDLGQFLKAKKEIAPVLASGTNKNKEYAFLVVNRIKSEAPELYDENVWE